MNVPRERKWVTVLLCILLMYSLYASQIAYAQGAAKSSVVLFSSGTILSSSPSPSPTPSAVNLAPTTTGWSLTPYGLSQYVFIDNTVLYNGQSTLRVGPDYDQATPGGTENDRGVYPTGGNWGSFSVQPGDHLYFSVWIKTDHSSQGNDGRSDKGARIGIDFYNSNGLIPTSPPNVPAVASGSFVPWGTSTWTQFTYDIIVPSGYDITSCIPWLQVIGSTDTGNAWYGNIEFYIFPK